MMFLYTNLPSTQRCAQTVLFFSPGTLAGATIPARVAIALAALQRAVTTARRAVLFLSGSKSQRDKKNGCISFHNAICKSILQKKRLGRKSKGGGHTLLDKGQLGTLFVPYFEPSGKKGS